MGRIFQKNRSLKQDPQNPYAKERLQLRKIRQDIEHINQHIEHLQQMKQRLRQPDFEPEFRSGEIGTQNGKSVRQN